jgi:hypothetical protein
MERNQMITLISKTSSLIQFPGGSQVIGRLPRTLTVTIETGVAVFNLVGTNPHDWTRDTLSFPVGNSIPRGDFVSGMALGHPASFWTPLENIQVVGGGSETVSVQGDDGSGGWTNVQLPGSLVPPPIGYAVDSAVVTLTTGASHAQITLALAVFGNNAAMQRCGYTAYIVTAVSEIIAPPPIGSLGS